MIQYYKLVISDIVAYTDLGKRIRIPSTTYDEIETIFHQPLTLTSEYIQDILHEFEIYVEDTYNAFIIAYKLKLVPTKKI